MQSLNYNKYTSVHHLTEVEDHTTPDKIQDRLGLIEEVIGGEGGLNCTEIGDWFFVINSKLIHYLKDFRRHPGYF